MRDYNMPNKGLFGRRCKILHGFNREPFVYRIVNSGIRSNGWCEVPLTYYSEREIVSHDDFEDVVIVVCDTLIDEKSKLVRVALKDVELMNDDAPTIDAIPVEWLRHIQNMHEDMKGLRDTKWWAIETVLQLWRERQEEDHGNV